MRRRDGVLFAVNRDPSTRVLHHFGWAMLFGFGVLGAVLWLVPWVRGGGSDSLSFAATRAQVVALCFWGLGVALLAVSYSPKELARPVYVGWMSVSAAIGRVMSTILLTIVFFLVLPVFALIARHKDPLRRRLHAGASYWEDAKQVDPSVDRMRRPF
jgi:hypothetical protein